MTLEEKNTKLLELQCKHGVFAKCLANALSVGKCSKEMLNRNTFIAFNIDMLRRFKPFKEEVTNGYKLTFSKNKELENVNISIEVDSTLGGLLTLATYSGTNSLEYILTYLQSVINNGTNIHGYYAELKNNILYLYTYETTEDYSSTLIVNFTDGEDDDSLVIAVDTLEGIENELLDLWNCISLEDFNKISKCILKEYEVKELINLPNKNELNR